MNYKLKLIETVEDALDELDRLQTKEERGAMAIWFSDFALEAAASLSAYAALGADMRPIVRKGLAEKHAKARKLLKE
jgi:hypothetical protein